MVVWGVLWLTWQIDVIKKAFKFVLQFLILSQKQILGVKNLVSGGLDVVCGGLEVAWGVSEDPEI